MSKIVNKKGEQEKKREKELLDMPFQASIRIENKICEVALTSSSLENLIASDKPVNSLAEWKKLHFMEKTDEEMDEIESNEEAEPIEWDKNKQWNKANKEALSMYGGLVQDGLGGVVIISTNLSQFAKPNDRWFFQDIPFTKMINSNKYLKEKKECPPYTIYLFRSNRFIFDNITIDGCVYVANCVIDVIGHFHITQYLIRSKQTCIRYAFQQYISTIRTPINADKFAQRIRNSYKNSTSNRILSLIRFLICYGLQIYEYFNWLGDAYVARGEYNKAIEYFKKSLAIRLAKLGPNHIDIGTLYYALGISYNERGKCGKAYEYLKEAWKIRLKHLGSRHSDVITSYDCLGRIYYREAKYNKAYKYHIKALQNFSEKTHKNPRKVALCYNHLGNVYYGKGSYGEAIKSYKNYLKIVLEKFGTNHAELAMPFNNLGVVYFERGQYAISISYHQMALDIRLKKFGRKHPATAKSLNELGLVWIKGKKQIKKAKEYIDEALEILINDKSGNFDLDLAKSYDVLGLILEKKGTNEEAIQYFEKSLKIKLKKLNNNHPCISWSFHYLASAFKNKNELSQSIKHGEKALKLRLRKLDCNHPDIGESYDLLGDIHFVKRDKTKTTEYYKNAIKIFTEIFGKQHPKTQDMMLKLEKINGEKNVKWWEERAENDKIEIVQQFESLPRSVFRTWLLNQRKGNNNLNHEDIP
ncbi:hypothetical protein RFI_30251, partial [Reticulomyxa filosa]